MTVATSHVFNLLWIMRYRRYNQCHYMNARKGKIAWVYVDKSVSSACFPKFSCPLKSATHQNNSKLAGLKNWFQCIDFNYLRSSRQIKLFLEIDTIHYISNDLLRNLLNFELNRRDVCLRYSVAFVFWHLYVSMERSILIIPLINVAITLHWQERKLSISQSFLSL